MADEPAARSGEAAAGTSGQAGFWPAALAMAGLSVAGMLMALDQTVVGSALPRMVADLRGFALYPWVAVAYLLTSVVVIPVVGSLGDLHGRKPYLLAAIGVFVLASVLCGLSASMLQLVLARALQGVGGGMLLGSVFATVSDLFPHTLQRLRWHAMITVSFGSAAALGPVLGGWMTAALGWRSIFYLNLPVGLVALAMVWCFLPWRRQVELKPDAIDWLGIVLLAAASASLLLTLEFSQVLGPGSLSLWGLLGAAAMLSGAFVRHLRRAPVPLVPPSLFRNAAVCHLSCLAVLTGFVMFVVIYYGPLLLQAGFRIEPARAGGLISPVMLGVMLGSLVNGRLIPRVQRPERLFAHGVALGAVGLGGLCLLDGAASDGSLLLVFLLCGLGFGFQLPNLTIQMQDAVERRHVGIASALIQSLRALGNMLGASLAGLLVNVLFAGGMDVRLAAAGITDPWVKEVFNSPQILLRAEDQARVVKLGTRLAFDPATLVEAARSDLIDGVHAAFALCLLLAGVSYLLGRRLPPYVRRLAEARADEA